MIVHEDIEYVIQNTDIAQLVREYGVELAKAGANYVGRCPFHNEKTGSFYIYTRSNRYVCFGCGESGDAAKFVMKKQNCSFVDAIKELARRINYDLQDEVKESAEEIEKRKKKMVQYDINEAASFWFVEQLRTNNRAMSYVGGRWKQDTIEQWGIGYAPDDFNALYNYLRKRGFRTEDLYASKLFAVSEKSGKIYSVFRDRIMFPFRNVSKKVVGFTGRFIEEKDDHRKYVNTADCDEYKKSEYLFGWDMAWDEARKKDEVIIVEGNPDVVKMHQLGIRNVVAACGLSLSKEQLAMIAKRTQNVVMMYDGDEAGQRKLESNGRKILDCGMNAFVFVLPHQEGEKQDPDTFFKSSGHYEEVRKECRYTIYEHLARKYKPECTDAQKTALVVKDISKLLMNRNESELVTLLPILSKIIPTKPVWTAAIKEVREEEKAKEKAKKIDEQGFTKEQRDTIDYYGFYVQENCYKIQNTLDGGGHTVSNFVLEPLFHIESTVNAKRLYRLKNNRGIVKELEIAQKDLVSLTAFKTRVESFGNFLFTGNDSDMNKIKRYLYENTKTCREVEQLGWQKEGFWAWSNGIIGNGSEWIPIDELGTVEYAKQHFYLPALSRFFVADTQLFQYERKFVHKESDASLHVLVDKMMSVYGNNAVVGTCYYLATLFRDIIFFRNNSFPILNIFGQKGTGKTEMAITLLKLFGEHGDGLNMTNSTLPAMADHVSHCRNALVHIDEYKNSVEYEKVEFLKGLYDGTGRSRMNMDRDKKKEMTPVDCGIILTGQEMTTADNALFSRVIFLTFSRTVFTAEQNKNYEDLKAYEKKGLTQITNQLLSLRSEMVEHYESNLKDVKEELRASMETKFIEGRILQNWTVLLATLKTLDPFLQMPFTYKDALPIFIDGIESQNAAVKSSNEISRFWMAVESMLTDGKIESDYDMKLVFGREDFTLDKGTGHARKKITYSMKYDLIYLNPNRVFVEYAKLMKSTKDSKASVMSEESLRHYLQTGDEYLGDTPKNFKVPIKNRQNPTGGMVYSETGGVIKELYKTSRALVFNYAKLVENFGIDLNVKQEVSEDAPKIEMPY